MMDAPTIDRGTYDRLLESFGGDAGFLAEMLSTFFDDSPRQLAALQAALAAGDGEGARRAAHSLKSNSAIFGALALSADAREIEMLTKEGRLQDARTKIASLAAKYAQVEQCLRELSDGT